MSNYYEDMSRKLKDWIASDQQRTVNFISMARNVSIDKYLAANAHIVDIIPKIVSQLMTMEALQLVNQWRYNAKGD